LISLTLLVSATSVFAQADIPPEVVEAFERAMLETSDLSANYQWQPETSPQWSGFNYSGKWLHKPINDDGTGGGMLFLSLSYKTSYNDYTADDFNNFIYQSHFEHHALETFTALPLAYKTYSGDGSVNVLIKFYINNIGSGHLVVNCPSVENSALFNHSEAERLAKLVWSRLPAEWTNYVIDESELIPGSIPDQSTPQDLISTGEMSAANDSGTFLGDSDTESPISDTALPLAVGATAALAALGALGAALTNGTTPAEALGELKELLRGGRSPKDILANPRLHDKITDADGKQWVYYHRPGDLAGDGWTPAEEYQQTLKQNKQGKTYSERWGWTSKEEAQSYEANLERQRELEREDALKRQEEMRLAAQKRAEAERLRREAEAKALEERRAAAIRKRDEGLAKAEYWNRQARFYDYAAKSAELVKAGADKSIDMLADVTGPKGKTIRTAYRAATALAKGVGEGMASGNWTDSMTDAAGTMAADLMEGKIGSERYKKAYGVFREGAANAWQQGRQAWRTGEDVTGTAAQAFLEGAVAKASEDFKETLGTKGSYFYEAGEKAIKNSYNAFKDGATVKDALFESSAEALGSAGDSLVDHTLGQTFDRILPENVSSNSGLLNDIYADLKDEATGKVIEGTQSFLKGDGFNIEI